MRFTLRQLQVFVATARLENISRAAEALAMSQSAASSALKELESHYSVNLFDRAGKRLMLNEHGRALQPQVEALLSQAQGLDESLSQQPAAESLRVGATLTIGNYLAVDIMAAYLNQAEDDQIALTVANTESIVDRLLHFDLDVGLVEGELNHTHLTVTEWCDDELVLFTHVDSPLAGISLTDQQLTQLPWVVREPGSGTRQGFDRAMSGLIGELNLRLQLQHTEAIKRAVQVGLGVGCLSAISVKEDFERGLLTPIYAPHRNWARKFYFVLHKHKYHGPAVARWLTLCREHVF